MKEPIDVGQRLASLKYAPWGSVVVTLLGVSIGIGAALLSQRAAGAPHPRPQYEAVLLLWARTLESD